MRRALEVALGGPVRTSRSARCLRPGRRELAVGRNERELTGDPTAHAEILALRRAGADGAGPLAAGRVHPRGDLGTLHDVRGRPRPGPGLHRRLRRLGAQDRRGRLAVGRGAGPPPNHRPEVYGGVLEPECAAVLRSFPFAP